MGWRRQGRHATRVVPQDVSPADRPAAQLGLIGRRRQRLCGPGPARPTTTGRSSAPSWSTRRQPCPEQRTMVSCSPQTPAGDAGLRALHRRSAPPSIILVADAPGRGRTACIRRARQFQPRGSHSSQATIARRLPRRAIRPRASRRQPPQPVSRLRSTASSCRPRASLDRRCPGERAERALACGRSATQRAARAPQCAERACRWRCRLARRRHHAATGGEPQAGHGRRRPARARPASSSAAMRVQATCSAAATNSVLGSARPGDVAAGSGRPAPRDRRPTRGERRAACTAGSGSAGAASMRVEDARERHAPAIVALAAMADRAARPCVGAGQRPAGRPASASMLGVDERPRACAGSASAHGRRQRRAAARRAWRTTRRRDRAAVRRGRSRRPTPTVSSAHCSGLADFLRAATCDGAASAQPPVTEPRVMARDACRAPRSPHRRGRSRRR